MQLLPNASCAHHYHFQRYTMGVGGEEKVVAEVNPDPGFIQSNEHRATSTTIEAENIPIISLSPLSSSAATATESLIEEIRDACKNWGFFQVIDHGVPVETREGLESAARKFFGLTIGEKKKVKRDEDNPLGYYDAEHTKNIRDWKEIFDYTVLEPTLVPASHEPSDLEIKELRNQWPQYPTDFRAACEAYGDEMVKLSSKLLQLIAQGLIGGAAEETLLNAYFRDHASFVRINYYPPCPFPDLALGVGPHTDSGALTVLAQDHVGGLQVRRKYDGEWISVKPIPDAYIVNVGDVIQVWSNDEYESVVHRVKVSSDKERLSIPFFFNPSHYVMVKPLLMDDLVVTDYPSKKKNQGGAAAAAAKYREYNYGKFYTTRRLSDFKKLNVDNIQISHFRV